MTYENSPACLLLATNCACCGRPLVDAKSVELGIGPDCRAKYGFDDVPTAPDFIAARTIALNFAADLNDETVLDWTDARVVCNLLVHRYASDHKANAWAATAIHALGYVKLSAKLLKRAKTATVEIRSVDATTLSVRAPFSPEFNAALKAVPGRRWDGAAKVWRVPVTARKALWGAVRSAFTGLTLVSDKGTTAIA